MKKMIFGFPVTMVLLAIFTLAIITATFIEASLGTETARQLVYNSHWFELVLAMLTVNIVGSLFIHHSFSWRKITVPLFHLSFVLIMVGAFFTRYTGTEGMVFIREGEKTDIVQQEGEHEIQLPFQLYLEDFELKRYPGSNSPSSYSSYVKVDDVQKHKNFDYHIYMNHILKYRGWRFFQTSYDQDEKGTVLTASRDVIGTPLTYAGYFITVVTLLMSLFMPGTFFRKQLIKLRQVSVVVLFLLVPIFGFSANEIDRSKVVDVQQAKEFGELVVQDFKGRMKTMNTLDNELMRKLYNDEKLDGLTGDQVVLSMLVYPEYWATVPIIKVKNEQVREALGMDGAYLSYEKLFHQATGTYLLNTPINQIFSKAVNERNKTDKAYIQIDDNANLLHLFLKGEALTIFPVKNAENHKWYSANDAVQYAQSTEDSLFLANIFPMYLNELALGKQSGNYSQSGYYLAAIKKYQETVGAEVILSPKKIKAELAYNSWNIFGRIKYYFALAGFAMLIFFFVYLIKGKAFPLRISLVFLVISIVLLVITAVGIGLRWFIGGYIPLSNSFEVNIFLSVVALLSGVIIARKQPLVLALSLILSFAFLLVAGMNNANPEIGNLVPVLKSYWLSIHVAVITSSYALFALAMMISFINLLLYLFSAAHNFKQLLAKTEQLGVLVQILLPVALYMLTIGTILGAVWANESWGRYWGWDPKETWALVSILIYAFVAHMRFIPAIKNEFWINLASFWAFASILMTFFGVNYLLSGMHSYAGVGNATMPVWIINTAVVLIVITALSGVKYFKMKKKISL